MATAQIRPATIEDAPVILQILRTAFEEYRDQVDPPSGALSETLPSVRGYLETEQALLLEAGGHPVACVFFLLDADSLYLHRLAVLPDHRRRGHARALMAAVEAEARRHRCRWSRLSVRTSLLSNLFLYEGLGYRVIEEKSHPGYDVVTFYAMVKDLDNPVAFERPRTRRIEVVPYDPAWPDRFADEAARLRPILGSELIELHHIGSTAVVGLHAKPIIDMLPVVRDITRVNRLNPWMISAGYRPRGENGIAGRRYFVKGSDLARTHHVHVYQQDHPEIARHVDFVAYLNAHPAEAGRYAALKQDLARRYPDDVHDYVAGKSALVHELDARAAQWRADTAR